MDKEQWKDIDGYEGLYQVSNMGRVASYDRIRSDGVMYKGCIKNLTPSVKGYLCTSLYDYNGERKTFLVARLIALTFIPNPDNKPQVNHINGDKFDNRVENLEWCNNSENQIHAYSIGLNFFPGEVGELNRNSKLTEDDVKKIKELLSYKDLTHKEISEIFGVDQSTVSNINTGRTWKHI
jgi:hypothetical protein